MSLYLLLEYQSAPDPWLRLRLLRYCCRIWEADRRSEPERATLQPIVPVVFYQGPRRWTASPELAELFPEAARAWPWVPRFAHELLDQTTLAPEAVAGGLQGRITQLLMMAAFNRHLEAALELTAQLLPVLRQRGGGGAAVRRFVLYLLATQDAEVIATFREALRCQGREEGEEIMTYAQELLAEGEAKGRVEVVEGFLRVGVIWEVIEAATGLTEADFQALKAHLAGAGS